MDSALGSGARVFGVQLRFFQSEIRNPKSEIAWLASTAADTNAFAEYKKLRREIQECRGGQSPTVVTVAWKPYGLPIAIASWPTFSAEESAKFSDGT